MQFRQILHFLLVDRMYKVTMYKVHETLRAAWFFVVPLRGPQNISNFWGEEEVRLLYTKRVLLVATSHFRRGVALFRKAMIRYLYGISG